MIKSHQFVFGIILSIVFTMTVLYGNRNLNGICVLQQQSTCEGNGGIMDTAFAKQQVGQVVSAEMVACITDICHCDKLETEQPTPSQKMENYAWLLAYAQQSDSLSSVQLEQCTDAFPAGGNIWLRYHVGDPTFKESNAEIAYYLNNSWLLEQAIYVNAKVVAQQYERSGQRIEAMNGYQRILDTADREGRFAAEKQEAQNEINRLQQLSE